MTALSVLSSGVDTLHLSARGELKEGLLVCFQRMLEISEDPGEPVPFDFHDAERPSFLLRRRGTHHQPVWLSSPRFEVFLGARHPLPQAVVQLHSPFIHERGIEAALDEAASVLRTELFSGEVTAAASRVDLYADEQGWQPRSADFDRFTCRARSRRLYEVPRQQHRRGRRLSGFVFGRDAVVARIYDKTLEMAIRGQTWQELLWERRDQERPVWRVEFQLRREALRSFRIGELDHVLHARQGLWEYGMSWLVLRRPTQHVDADRWPVDPVWADLRQTWMGSPRSALVRERIRGSDQLRLVRGLVGYATSLAAVTNDEALAGVVTRHVPGARAYLARRGESFAEVADRKRRSRLVTPPRPLPGSA